MHSIDWTQGYSLLLSLNRQYDTSSIINYTTCMQFIQHKLGFRTIKKGGHIYKFCCCKHHDRWKRRFKHCTNLITQTKLQQYSGLRGVIEPMMGNIWTCIDQHKHILACAYMHAHLYPCMYVCSRIQKFSGGF